MKGLIIKERIVIHTHSNFILIFMFQYTNKTVPWFLTLALALNEYGRWKTLVSFSWNYPFYNSFIMLLKLQRLPTILCEHFQALLETTKLFPSPLIIPYAEHLAIISLSQLHSPKHALIIFFINQWAVIFAFQSQMLKNQFKKIPMITLH